MLWTPVQQPVISPRGRGQPFLYALFVVWKPWLPADALTLEEEWGRKWATVWKKGRIIFTVLSPGWGGIWKCPGIAPNKGISVSYLKWVRCRQLRKRLAQIHFLPLHHLPINNNKNTSDSLHFLYVKCPKHKAQFKKMNTHTWGCVGTVGSVCNIMCCHSSVIWSMFCPL